MKLENESVEELEIGDDSKIGKVVVVMPGLVRVRILKSRVRKMEVSSKEKVVVDFIPGHGWDSKFKKFLIEKGETTTLDICESES